MKIPCVRMFKQEQASISEQNSAADFTYLTLTGNIDNCDGNTSPIVFCQRRSVGYTPIQWRI